MKKYTDGLVKCEHCGRANNFLITIAKENGQQFYVTQCPKCKKYDEVKRISDKEAKSFTERSERLGRD